MRASRLLLILLLLQNRGRQTSGQLAAELEVSRRTILRDLDALSEAGLPVVVFPGRGGGVELGFNYRTRLTGLSSDEAEALGVILGQPSPMLAAVGLAEAAVRARTKLMESLPDQVRGTAQVAQRRFPVGPAGNEAPDPRLPALADAVRRRSLVRIRSTEADRREIHPVAISLTGDGWHVVDEQDPDRPIPLADCGTINISRLTF